MGPNFILISNHKSYTQLLLKSKQEKEKENKIKKFIIKLTP